MTNTAEQSREWPVLKSYDKDHTLRVALPLGGIGHGYRIPQRQRVAG